MSAEPRVLFVSKPVVAPWNDGSKNLVRDVATHLTRARPTVLTTPGAPPLGGRVMEDAIYQSSGRFAPGLVANARVLLRLTTGDAHDVWSFVFAPNRASSSAAELARAIRRAAGWRGKVVQTVASAPQRFDGVDRLLFGDVVVVLSEWTRGRMVGSGVSAGKLRVIPPCAASPGRPSDESLREVRARYALGDAKLVLYPGDYEVSQGAATLAEAIKTVARDVPEARFVYACREKTPRAAVARSRIEDQIRAAGLSDRVRHVGEVDHLPALLAASSVVAFPVDDLYGKVDLPLVLLEALALGVPLLLARDGPLESITSARLVSPRDPADLAASLTEMLTGDPGRAATIAAQGLELYTARFTPRVVAAQYDDLYEEMLVSALPGTP